MIRTTRRHGRMYVCRVLFWLGILSCTFLVGQSQDNGESNTTTTTNNGGDEECPLTCLNDSKCAEGDANFSNNEPTNIQGDSDAIDEIHKDKSIDGYHCSCLQGFTGVTCGVLYESCADSNDRHICYHGGECVPGIVDEYGNEQYYCDCTKAVEDGKRYAGRYCESVAVSICDSDTHSFCVNDGVCKDNPNANEPPCYCSDEFTGAHCEYTKDSVPENCDLTCYNGGSCQHGIPTGDYPDDTTAASAANDGANQDDETNSVAWLTHGGRSSFTYCLCKDGYHGVQCESDQTECGLGQCHHGSPCVESAVISGEFYCDCSAINTPYKSYAGIYCQFEASDYCPASLSFCVNGGVCVDEGAGIFSCDCAKGYHGPKCEFETDDSETTNEADRCRLHCFNDGKCRKGMKDLGDYQHLNTNEIPELNITATEQSEHCVCPTGFVGLQCETAIEECGINAEHICLHGSKCQRNDHDNGKWTCTCQDAFSTNNQQKKYYAGEFCQHHHTMMCTVQDQVGVYEGLDASLAFCVNDGICKDIIEDGERHPGCDCPKGYTGAHCELLDKIRPEDIQSTSPENLDPDASAPAAIVFVLLLVGIVFGVLSLAIYYRHQYEIRLRHMQENNAVNESDIMEQIAFTSSQRFEDVELT